MMRNRCWARLIGIRSQSREALSALVLVRLYLVPSRSTRGASGCDLMWGRDRRPRVCFASTHSGRSGTPPPATKGRREELADGEAITSDCLTKSAAPGCEIAERSAARRRASGSRREQDLRSVGRRSVPLISVRGSHQASGRKPLARTFRHARHTGPASGRPEYKPCAGHPRLSACNALKRGWHRNSGLPEFRTVEGRKSGKPDLRCQAPP